MEVKIDIPSQKLAVYVRPTAQTPTVLGHYHIMPYTTIGQINKLQILNQVVKNLSIGYVKWGTIDKINNK